MRIANQEVQQFYTTLSHGSDGKYRIDVQVNFENKYAVSENGVADKNFDRNAADRIGSQVKSTLKPAIDALDTKRGKMSSYAPQVASDNIVLDSSVKTPEEAIKKTRAATYTILTEVLGASPQEAEQYAKTKIKFPKEMQELAASMPFPDTQPKQPAAPAPQPKPIQEQPKPKLEPKVPEPGLLATEAGTNHDYTSKLRKYANELKDTWPQSEKYDDARSTLDSLVQAASRYGQETTAGKDPSPFQKKVNDIRYGDAREIQDPKTRAQVEALLNVVDKSMSNTKMQKIMDQYKAASPPPKPEPKNDFLNEAKVEAGTGKNEKDAPKYAEFSIAGGSDSLTSGKIAAANRGLGGAMSPSGETTRDTAGRIELGDDGKLTVRINHPASGEHMQRVRQALEGLGMPKDQLDRIERGAKDYDSKMEAKQLFSDAKQAAESKGSIAPATSQPKKQGQAR